ncbi:hypothetical protein F5B22DRAFT_599265 [Xylaria bambusicola]|uniref:uncharacterized protein n=1 Tax=Xylaria bambusicola TaxID=326684 RepID=UPI002007F245|nr:uncharacterized protein F5B22DRAFT_599265 [Xylaria bambusicola]KAI0518453.1 hypothetical protein F5B22DRAFT_599265 [Xylaria bambusicola]
MEPEMREEDRVFENLPVEIPQHDILAFPRLVVGEGKLGYIRRGLDCFCCLEFIPTGEEVLKLPCGHWFHTECICTWAMTGASCPNCHRDFREPLLDFVHQPREQEEDDTASSGSRIAISPHESPAPYTSPTRTHRPPDPPPPMSSRASTTIRAGLSEHLESVHEENRLIRRNKF